MKTKFTHEQLKMVYQAKAQIELSLSFNNNDEYKSNLHKEFINDAIKILNKLKEDMK